MDKLIEVINKLQDAFSRLGTSCPIDLPQIAVVGGQSAGKSSVLENFVGRDFLPRGSGIVTRRPLVLQLINSSSAEYGEFLHKPNVKMTNFAHIRQEIEDETDRVTGKNKNISPLPINLRIYSPYVLDLTLVDLPGLTKVPVGDQPKDIDFQIKTMVNNFISNPNCIILAVTPANIDLANSDALLCAREADPQGSRTIGVITKIDLMDKGTDCRDILLNLTYPLKRGYVGIVNRSQQDIEGKKDIRAAQEAERNYFLNHRSYSDIADKCGTPVLQLLLNQQLSNHIKTTIPTLKQKLLEQINKLEPQISMAKQDVSTPQGRSKALMVILQEFVKTINESLGYNIDEVSYKELNFGAKINSIMTERFPYEMKKIKQSPEEIKNEIMISIKNAQGIRNSIFTPDAAFTTVVKSKIEEIRPIAQMIVDKIIDELKLVIDNACVNCVGKYINLQDEIKTIMMKELFEYQRFAKNQVNLLIDMEVSHINTKHPDFIEIAECVSNNSTIDGIDDNEKKSGSTIVFRKGYLEVGVSFFKTSKDSWFVLKGDNLLWYKDEFERELKVTIDLRNVCCRPLRKNSFTLFNKTGVDLFKDGKTLNLVAASEEDAEDWKACLVVRGVLLESKNSKKTITVAETVRNKDQLEIQDPTLYRQIETLRKLIESYLKIVVKTQSDLVSKVVVCLIINKICLFGQGELIATIYGNGNVDNLMNESQEEIHRKQEVLKIYSACKEALNVLNDVFNSDIFLKEETSYASSNKWSTNTYTQQNSYSAPKRESAPIPVRNPVNNLIPVRENLSQTNSRVFPSRENLAINITEKVFTERKESINSQNIYEASKSIQDASQSSIVRKLPPRPNNANNISNASKLASRFI